MMAEDWLALQPPTTCGKRPRSPVDKLADLAASAEDDEQDWRSSKRYLTEVIANGFSKLSFKLGMPPHAQQQQLGGAFDSAGPLQQQQQANASPRSHDWLAGQLGGSTQHLQLPDPADCPMDTQMSPPSWPPQPKTQQQQQQQQQQQPGFTAPSPCSGTGGGILSGAWGAQADSFAQQYAAQQGMQPQQGLGLQAACSRCRTPSPEPSSSPAGSPRIPSAPSATEAAAAAAPTYLSRVGSPDEAAGGSNGNTNSSRPTLPPLQTAKVRAAEKQPASPSDLPAASLRKVALLRSLLARAEQQFHQQQGSGQQQQPAQPSRMQPGAAGQPTAFQQHQRQQNEAEESSRPPWMQPWGAVPDSSTGGQQQLQQQQQQQPPVLPPRPVTPWDMSSDDMDCSSASSMMDSFASSSQSGLQEPAGLQQVVDQDQAASALLCREVLLFPAGDDSSTWAVGSMQQQPQLQQDACSFGGRARQSMQLPFFNQAGADSALGPASAQQAPECVNPQQQQQQQQQPSSRPGHGQQRRSDSSMLAARQGSPELSRQKLEELRAKALASTHQLTCLTQEDLHSLQLGLASRRGSVDSHAPSGLQQEGSRDEQGIPPALRRHSSHI